MTEKHCRTCPSPALPSVSVPCQCHWSSNFKSTFPKPHFHSLINTYCLLSNIKHNSHIIYFVCHLSQFPANIMKAGTFTCILLIGSFSLTSLRMLLQGPEQGSLKQVILWVIILFVTGPVLRTMGCLAASLVSTQQMPEVPCPTVMTIRTVFKHYPMSWGTKSPPAENRWARGTRKTLRGSCWPHSQQYRSKPIIKPNTCAQESEVTCPGHTATVHWSQN